VCGVHGRFLLQSLTTQLFTVTNRWTSAGGSH